MGPKYPPPPQMLSWIRTPICYRVNDSSTKTYFESKIRSIYSQENLFSFESPDCKRETCMLCPSKVRFQADSLVSFGLSCKMRAVWIWEATIRIFISLSHQRVSEFLVDFPIMVRIKTCIIVFIHNCTILVCLGEDVINIFVFFENFTYFSL